MPTLDYMIRGLAVLIEFGGALLIVFGCVRGLARLAADSGRRTAIVGARLAVADGIVAGLGFKTAATLLRTIELRSWNAILMFCLVILPHACDQAAASASRSSGSRRRCHDNCLGAGSGGGEDGAVGSVACRTLRRRIVVLAGRVRRSDSQRRTCFTVPGKPRTRNSRQSCIAFSQPAPWRACRRSR